MKKVRLKNEYTEEAYLIIGNSEANFRRMVFHRQRDYKGWEDGEAAGRTENPVQDGVTIYLIWLPKDVDNNTIAHEVVHLKNYIFHDHGVPLDHEKDETEAYFIGYIVGQIYKALGR